MSWGTHHLAVFVLFGAFFAAPLTGCSPIGLAHDVGAIVTEDRSTNQQAADVSTKLKVRAAIFDTDRKLFQAVGTEVYNGQVLLTGAVTSADAQAQAVAIAHKVEGVKSVINEIQITNEGGLGAFVEDTVAEQKIGAKLLGDREIKSVNYSVRAVNGTVYLLGVARDKTELDRAIGHARSTEHVRRVISHVKLRGAP
ncbi:MAG: BON domain-containing protein [Rhodospirillales bacterium]|nr:BON domain-containing protein [Rhodospirillales bacterium]